MDIRSESDFADDEAVSSPIIRISDTGSILTANSASWLILQNWGISTGDQVPPPWFDRIELAIREKRIGHYILTAGYASIDMLIVPGPEKGGATIYGADVTRTRQVEKDLIIKAHLQAQAHEAILIADEEFRTIDINPAYTELTGFTEADVLGEPASFLRSLGADGTKLSELRNSLATEGEWHGELWDRKKGGQAYAVRIAVSAVHLLDPEDILYVAFMTDVTETKTTEKQLYHLAHYDNLTGLPNRRLFQDFADAAVAQASRLRAGFGLMMVDLDGFKLINDSLGHQAGDEFLRVVGHRLKESLRKSDVAGRFGGDEFAVLLHNVESETDARIAAEKVVERLSTPTTLDGHELSVTASAGIAVFPDDASTVTDLLRVADEAMYHVKRTGRNNVLFYSELPGVKGS